MTIKALSLTILVSFFFLIGILLPHFFKNKNKLLLFSTGLTFIILAYLAFFDLLPEIGEVLNPKEHFLNLFLIFIFVFFGFIILKILEAFIPEHYHNHQDVGDDEKEHNGHIFHIGFITSVSLIIHNMLEGISIYVTGLNDWKVGLIMAISVGCHNLPLGMEIAVGLEAKKEKKTAKYLILFFLVLSSFLGAFILFLLKKDLHPLFEGMLLCMTLGMILYINIFELLPEIKENKKQKEMKWGLLIGLLLAFILLFI